MQGVPLEPLLLLTQEEVERHEAASAVQAASRGRAERQSKGSVQEQLEARRRAEEEAALRGQAASRHPNPNPKPSPDPSPTPLS